MEGRAGGRGSARFAVLLALVTLIGAGIISVVTSRGSGEPAAATPTPASTTTTTAAAAPVSIAVATTTAPTATSTTTTTTTTTTIPQPRLLEIVAVPDNASISINTSDGLGITSEGVLSEMVVGPVELAIEAEGYQAHRETLEADADTELMVWLDRPGQLLHKIAQWSTAGAPKQVAFTPDNQEIWVTLLSGAGFQVFDRNGGLIAAVELPEAGSVEVIFNRAGTRGYVSQMETASVYEIDVATREVLRKLDTGGVWTKVMALSPDEATLWASNWVSNNVSEIDLATGEVRRKLSTVTTPRGLYVTPNGARLYVAGFEHGEIEVFDLATGDSEVIYHSGGAMRHLVGDPATGLMYASDMARHHVLVVDTATDEVAVLADVDRVPNTIDLSPDGKVLYVSNRGRNNPETYYKPGPEWGTVVVIDTATGNYLDAIIGGNQTTGLDVSPDGTMLAYSDFLDDRVTVYEIPPYEDLLAGDGGRWEAHLAEIPK
jgi:sugar lactone lactonase YvrE